MVQQGFIAFHLETQGDLSATMQFVSIRIAFTYIFTATRLTRVVNKE